MQLLIHAGVKVDLYIASYFLPTSPYVIQGGLTNTMYHGKSIKLFKAYAYMKSIALTGVAYNNDSHA